MGCDCMTYLLQHCCSTDSVPAMGCGPHSRNTGTVRGTTTAATTPPKPTPSTLQPLVDPSMLKLKAMMFFSAKPCSLVKERARALPVIFLIAERVNESEIRVPWFFAAGGSAGIEETAGGIDRTAHAVRLRRGGGRGGRAEDEEQEETELSPVVSTSKFVPRTSLFGTTATLAEADSGKRQKAYRVQLNAVDLLSGGGDVDLLSGGGAASDSWIWFPSKDVEFASTDGLKKGRAEVAEKFFPRTNFRVSRIR